MQRIYHRSSSSMFVTVLLPIVFVKESIFSCKLVAIQCRKAKETATEKLQHFDFTEQPIPAASYHASPTSKGLIATPMRKEKSRYQAIAAKEKATRESLEPSSTLIWEYTPTAAPSSATIQIPKEVIVRPSFIHMGWMHAIFRGQTFQVKRWERGSWRCRARIKATARGSDKEESTPTVAPASENVCAAMVWWHEQGSWQYWLQMAGEVRG